MSEITVETFVKWMDGAERDDLEKLADYLVERGYAADNEDVVDDINVGDELDEMFDEMDPGLLEEARAQLQRRDWREALHTLAAALGRDFDALELIPLRS